MNFKHIFFISLGTIFLNGALNSYHFSYSETLYAKCANKYFTELQEGITVNVQECLTKDPLYVALGTLLSRHGSIFISTEVKID